MHLDGRSANGPLFKRDAKHLISKNAKERVSNNGESLLFMLSFWNPILLL